MPVYFGYGNRLPRAVKTLLITNVSIFVFTSFMVTWKGLFFNLFGLVPYLVNHRLMVWQIFTYMFFHADIAHVLMNMFVLWMFGTELEHNWGFRDFLKYYFVCGIGGGVLVWFTSFLGLSNPLIPTIGASGAVFGILVAFGLMWPDRLIYFWGIFPMKALHLVLLFGAIDLFSGLSSTGGNIAVFAHVGGGVTGFIYLKYGWRIMIHLESFIKRIKRRKFKVTQGGAFRSKSSDIRDHNDTAHPDIDEEVDRILDKITREGKDSLTAREKNILDRASNRKRQ